MTSTAPRPSPDAASGGFFGRWMFALEAEKPHRLVFSLPWKRVVALGLVSAALGALVLHPLLEDSIHPYLRYVLAASMIVLGLVFAAAAVASDGQLTIDGLGRVVRFHLQTPWRQVSWVKPFDEFSQVQFYQVVDRHGLHNHWQVELLMKNGSVVRIGYGLLGAIRRSAADDLVKKVSALTGLPVQQLEKR